MLRTLIVENNPLFRESFKRVLHERFPSLVIEEAANGEEALQRILGAPPDLIFMDIRLPGENGLQLTQKIKKEFLNMRIALLTSYDFSEYRRAAAQFEADRFFIKDALE